MNWKHLVFGYIAYQVLKPKKKVAAIGKLKAHKFIPIYKELPKNGKNGKINIGFAKNQSGVYLIKENGKIVYVGHSKSNLYMTIMRHFYYWEDETYEGRKYTRFSYWDKIKTKRYTVRIVFTSPSRAEKLEAGLVKKHRPRDNQDKLKYILDLEKEEVEKVVQQYEEAEYEEAPF